jgi:hypothetical protein
VPSLRRGSLYGQIDGKFIVRNYVMFWGARLIQGGNYQSIVGDTEDDVNSQAALYIALGYSWSLRPFKAYILLNNDNVVGLLKNWVTHYPAAFGSTWIFFQDGLRALESPRDTWSHGE